MRKALYIAGLLPLAALASDYVNIPLSFEDAIARTEQDVPIACSAAQMAQLDFYDSLANYPDHPYYTQISQLPITVQTYTGGPAVVYIRVGCTEAPIVYRVHYSDATLQVMPNAPSNTVAQ